MKMKMIDVIKKSSDRDVAQIIDAVVAMRADGLSEEEAINIEYSELLRVLQVEVEVDYKPTNADRIRDMSDEELAIFLVKVNASYAEPCMIGEKDCKWEDYPDHSKGCKDCFKEWLQTEVEE